MATELSMTSPFFGGLAAPLFLLNNRSVRMSSTPSGQGMSKRSKGTSGADDPHRGSKRTAHLRLDEEVNRIGQGLERTKEGDRIKVVVRWAVTEDDVRRSCSITNRKSPTSPGNERGMARAALVET
jgi:hypothetical protein